MLLIWEECNGWVFTLKTVDNIRLTKKSRNKSLIWSPQAANLPG